METHYVQAKIINKCQQVKHPEIYSTGLNYNVKTITQTALYFLVEQFQYQCLMMLKPSDLTCAKLWKARI
jgi:hypothetical protein